VHTNFIQTKEIAHTESLAPVLNPSTKSKSSPTQAEDVITAIWLFILLVLWVYAGPQ
jgi:hypothetical protein